MVKLTQQIVKKAGGIIRDGKNFFAVKRNAYNDISLPKGHIDNGESVEDTALREVLEETGFDCKILEDLGVSEYINFEGIVQVQYFAMRIIEKKTDKLFPDVDGIICGNSEIILNQLSYSSDKIIFTKAIKFFDSIK